MAGLTKHGVERALRVVSEEEDGMLLKTPLTDMADMAHASAIKGGLHLAEYDLGDPRIQSLKEWGPDVAVMISVLWCWSSWYSSSVEWLQLLILTSASVVSFGRVYFIRTLKGQLDHFKDENKIFKVSNAELKDVVSSLRTKNEHFKHANQDLQCSIAGLEHVREVIETHAAKTNGDFSNILGELQRSVSEQKRIQRNTQQIQERIRDLCQIQSQTMMMNLFSTCQLSDPEGGMIREEFDIFLSMLPSSISDKLDGNFTFDMIDIDGEGVITPQRMRDWVQEITDQILEAGDPLAEAPRGGAGGSRSESKRVIHTSKSNSPTTRGGGLCGLWNASRGLSTDSPYHAVASSPGVREPALPLVATAADCSSGGTRPSPRRRGSPPGRPVATRPTASGPASGAPSREREPPSRSASACQLGPALYTPGEGITQAPRRSSPGRRGGGLDGRSGQASEFRVPIPGAPGEASSPAPGAASSVTSPQAQFLQRVNSKAALESSPGYGYSPPGNARQASRLDSGGTWPLRGDDRHPSCSGSTSTAFDCSTMSHTADRTMSSTFDSPQVTSSFTRGIPAKGNI